MVQSLVYDNSIEVYQLRIWIKGISPMIWRRLLVKSSSTIADLHYTIQIAMGWGDEHLNQFIIRGKSYGVYHDGGISFSDNPKQVYLNSFQFCLKEKFIYEYNFFDHWEHEIRFEKQLPDDSRKTYPLCIGGNHLTPPEDCGGAWAFMKLKDHYSPWNIEDKVIELFEDYEEGNADEEYVNEVLRTLAYWFHKQHLFKLNRKEVNFQLHQQFEDKKEAAAQPIKGG